MKWCLSCQGIEEMNGTYLCNSIVLLMLILDNKGFRQGGISLAVKESLYPWPTADRVFLRNRGTTRGKEIFKLKCSLHFGKCIIPTNQHKNALSTFWTMANNRGQVYFEYKSITQTLLCVLGNKYLHGIISIELERTGTLISLGLVSLAKDSLA